MDIFVLEEITAKTIASNRKDEVAITAYLITMKATKTTRNFEDCKTKKKVLKKTV